MGSRAPALVTLARATVLTLSLFLVSLRGDTALAHPLHTSLAELLYDSRKGSVTVSLRVFVDDFTQASIRRRQALVARHIKAAAPNPLVDYALASFQIFDGRRRQIPLESCGGKKVGELMWLCFRGTVPFGAREIKVSNRVLFDFFKDQINIVKSTIDGKQATVLFTPGDGAKSPR